MHPSALSNCQIFFQTYASAARAAGSKSVIEIGSQDVNGNLRSAIPADFTYTGVDFAVGRGVDVVLDDPYALPFEDGSVDIVISSSCFEHSEMFWIVFLEVLRVLKPHGLFYLNVPSNGQFHQHPVDCWRFYPDSGGALVTWARRNGVPAVLLESYVSEQVRAPWNDFVAIFLKNEAFLPAFPARILDSKRDFTNGRRHGHEGLIRHTEKTEDLRKLSWIPKFLRSRQGFR